MGVAVHTVNAILRKIIEEPDENLHRLVYADALDERGEPGDRERAEFIRDSIRVSNTPWHKLPVDWIVDFSTRRINYEQDYLQFYVGAFFNEWRGFFHRVVCDAATFLRHADELLWHPEQTVKCERCSGDGKAHGADRLFEWSPDADYGKCVMCKGTGRGGPRPCPPTAQPIREVVLTTIPRPEVIEFNMLREWVKPLGWGAAIRWSFEGEWPGVEFVLPSDTVLIAMGSSVINMTAGAPIQAGQLLMSDDNGRVVPAAGAGQIVGTAVNGTEGQ